MKLTRTLFAVLLATAFLSAGNAPAEPNTKNQSLEDQQQAAGAIVTKAKEFAKVQAKHAKEAQEAEKLDKPVTTLGEILSVCPKDIRIEFMESLAFLNGGVASVSNDGIKKCLKPEQMSTLLATMGHNKRPVATADKGEICRCSHVTWEYSCREWWSSSCGSSCTGSCKKD